MNGKFKTFHINLLKQYIDRGNDEANQFIEVCDSKCVTHPFVIASTATVEDDETDPDVTDPDEGNPLSNIESCLPVLKANETINDVRICEKLSEHQKADARRLLGNFRDVMMMGRLVLHPTTSN